MSPVCLPDEVRAACAWVVDRARFIRIEESKIEDYAADLAQAVDAPPSEGRPPGDAEAAAAFAVCMNAINFGSGWWPTIRKRPGLSGYGTVAAGVEERFSVRGPWSTDELAAMDAATIAAVLAQDPKHPLMAQFAAALRDVGAHLTDDYDGRYLGVVEGAESIPELAAVFAGWVSFADLSSYEGRDVPFFKRAQLAAADLHRGGVAPLPEVERLTAFADNLVPQVLRIDGILELDHALEERIEAEDLLDHGSPEEVELRAGAIHAVELLASCDAALTPAEIDSALWTRGGGRRYKSVPRPRSRNTAY
ncbi:MAG TPA: queuosine salvage family protein [Solirubrobacterales bacterium]